MAVGDVEPVTGCDDIYYVDTGMYETAAYGAVYIIAADRPAVIDTGIGTHVDRILAALEDVGITREEVAVIAPTHVHLDHAGGAGFLADACPSAQVYVHELGAPHLVDPDRLVSGTKRAVGDQWQFYTDPKPVPETSIVALSAGDTIDLGNRTLSVYHVPGHAPHQVIYYDSQDNAVFTADAAGIWIPSLERVVETSPPPNFDLEQCLSDVETIQALDPDHFLYPHFGPAPRSALDRYPSVLESWVETVESTLETHSDSDAAVAAINPDSDRVEVWGELKARAETNMNARGVIHYLHSSD